MQAYEIYNYVSLHGRMYASRTRACAACRLPCRLTKFSTPIRERRPAICNQGSLVVRTRRDSVPSSRRDLPCLEVDLSEPDAIVAFANRWGVLGVSYRQYEFFADVPGFEKQAQPRLEASRGSWPNDSRKARIVGITPAPTNESLEEFRLGARCIHDLRLAWQLLSEGAPERMEWTAFPPLRFASTRGDDRRCGMFQPHRRDGQRTLAQRLAQPRAFALSRRSARRSRQRSTPLRGLSAAALRSTRPSASSFQPHRRERHVSAMCKRELRSNLRAAARTSRSRPAPPRRHQILLKALRPRHGAAHVPRTQNAQQRRTMITSAVHPAEPDGLVRLPNGGPGVAEQTRVAAWRRAVIPTG